MASSGSITSGPANSYYYNRTITLNWWVNSQSIANNTTDIGWELKGSGGATNNWVTSGNFKVIIDGVERYFSGGRINVYNGTWIAGGTCTLWHDGSGNKSFSAYIEAGIGYVAVSQSASGSWSLNTIPRQANITSAPNFNDTQNPTIGYSNPAGNNVSSLQARIENAAGNSAYVQYRDINKTGSSYTYNLTEAERNVLRAACQNSKTLTVKFVIRTIIGGNTFWSTADRTLTIVNGEPTFSAAYADMDEDTLAITENNQQIIRNQSYLQINLTNVSAKKSATISSARAVINGTTYNGTATSASTYRINVGTINLSSNSTAAVTVTDSRGFSTTQNLELSVLNWQLPTAIITTARQSHYYTPTTLNVDADYSYLDGKNAISIKYRYEPVTTLPATNLFDYSSSYNASPNSPPSAITVTLNVDGSLTAAGTYETASPPICSVVDPTDITSILENGETYTLSQTDENASFYAYVIATQNGGSSEIYSTAEGGAISFVVDTTTYDQYSIGVTLDPSDFGRYEQFNITEAFSLVKDDSGGWSAWQTLQDNVPVVVNLNNEQAWNVQVVVADKLGSTIYNTVVSRGMPIVYFDSILSSVGINCFPAGEKTLEVNGVNAIRSVMTRYLPADLTNLTPNSYVKINLTGVTSFGDSLTATNDGGIKIGPNVSKILVSGRMLASCSVVGTQYIRICKNNASDTANMLAWVSHTNTTTSAAFETINATPALVNVQENDVIYLYYYVPASSGAIYGNNYGNQTSLTVETVA